MSEIKIVHVSDLHISEHLLRDPESHFKFPHRYGHDIQTFIALDNFLNTNAWDVLVITGDASRIGNDESFHIVRNWIYNKIDIEDITVGLDLNKKKSKHCIIIPGNHDRFNGGMIQEDLTNYHKEFDVVGRDEIITKTINGKTINFHLYDSSWNKGGFGLGKIEPSDLVPKNLNEGHFDIALLHHHFIQPPKHTREAATELHNSADVASYMLNSGFDCVMFGHTHQGYIGIQNIEALSGILNDKRTKGKFWRRLIPKIWLRKLDNDCLVSYRRECTKNGQLPTMDSYFNYLYMKKNNVKVLPPSEFETSKQFHDHIKKLTKDISLKKVIDKLKLKKILISLAPSACQAEAKWKGLHIITIFDDNKIEFDRYQFNGANFSLKDKNEHTS